MTIHVFLCDDDPKDLARYAEALRRTAQTRKWDLRLREFQSGIDLCEAIRLGIQPDILLLDVLMLGLNGIETGRRLRALGCTALIIYLTCSAEHVYSSFDAHPFHYLLKDGAARGRLAEVFCAAVDSLQLQAAQCYTFRLRGEIVRVPIREMIYVEACGHAVTLQLEGKPPVQQTARLRDVEKRLRAAGLPFLRVHRAYLVNPLFIRALRSDRLLLHAGQILPVGARYAASAREALTCFYLEHDV